MMSLTGNKIRPSTIDHRPLHSRWFIVDSRAQGVTLVEVLMAVVILSVGLVGVLRAYAFSLGALGTAQGTIDTTVLAKQKMVDIEQTILEQEGITAGSAKGNFEGVYSDYAWQSKTTARSTEPLYELEVTVFKEGESRQWTLVTYAENKDYRP